MTDEEKQAIDNFKFFNEGEYITREMAESKDVVLILLEKQQAEIEKKDKIIDLIVDRFQQVCVNPSLAKYQWKRICSEDLNICEGRLCEDCIKEYFKNKVNSSE